jgi:glycosyltransferase involved in cell wall biosynthesis
MVIGEAMSCGLPVITTTNTGGNEIIRNGIDGFIIPIRSIDALKEKILFFYENEEARIAMGRSGAEYIKNFTWDRYGENIVENYERLLEREI